MEVIDHLLREQDEEIKRLKQQVQALKNALAQYGQHAVTCAKRGCPANACDCGFFAAQRG